MLGSRRDSGGDDDEDGPATPRREDQPQATRRNSASGPTANIPWQDPFEKDDPFRNPAPLPTEDDMPPF